METIATTILIVAAALLVAATFLALGWYALAGNGNTSDRLIAATAASFMPLLVSRLIEIVGDAGAAGFFTTPTG